MPCVVELVSRDSFVTFYWESSLNASDCLDIAFLTLRLFSYYCLNQVTYDFTIMQGTEERPEQDSLMVLKVQTRERAYFYFTIGQERVLINNVFTYSSSQTMLKSRRINCLSHPVCFNIMNKKW